MIKGPEPLKAPPLRRPSSLPSGGSLAFHRRFGTSYCYNRRGRRIPRLFLLLADPPLLRLLLSWADLFCPSPFLEVLKNGGEEKEEATPLIC